MLSNKMFPSQAPLQLSLLLPDFVTFSLPDGDDKGQHFQQDGDDEHHDGRRWRRGRDHSVFQETRDKRMRKTVVDRNTSRSELKVALANVFTGAFLITCVEHRD